MNFPTLATQYNHSLLKALWQVLVALGLDPNSFHALEVLRESPLASLQPLLPPLPILT